MFFRRFKHSANGLEGDEEAREHKHNRDHSADVHHLRRSFQLAAYAVLVLWLIRVFENLTGTDLIRLAILPREPAGLIGILTAPLIHGDVAHLISNSLPILFLGTGLLYLYPRSAPIVLTIVYLGGGLAVWCFARSSAHLGASGLTYGLVTFLFFSGAIRRDPPSIGLALIVAFLYGGTIWGVLPIEQGISFESHLAGALLGIVCAVLLRHRDRLRKVIQNEDDDSDGDTFDPADAWDDESNSNDTDDDDYYERRD